MPSDASRCPIETRVRASGNASGPVSEAAKGRASERPRPTTTPSPSWRPTDAGPAAARIESIRGYEATLGRDHSETLDATNELGIVYIDWGRLDDAATWLARTLEARQRTLGLLHRHTIGTKCNLANVWKNQRRHAEAETAYRELIAVLPTALAEDDPYREAIPPNLVALLNDTGRYDECRQLLMPMLDERRRKRGDDHPSVLGLLTSLAVLQKNTGEVDAAIGTNRTILAAYERTLGRSHATTQRTLYNLANSLNAAKRPAEAEPLVREVFERRLVDLGRSNLYTANAANLLGTTLHDLGRFEDAVTSYREAFEVRRELFGAADSKTLGSAESLAAALAAAGHADERETLLRELLAELEALDPQPTEAPISCGAKGADSSANSVPDLAGELRCASHGRVRTGAGTPAESRSRGRNAAPWAARGDASGVSEDRRSPGVGVAGQDAVDRPRQRGFAQPSWSTILLVPDGTRRKPRKRSSVGW